MINHDSQKVKLGRCVLCKRETYLTFHHLIPRKLHRRPFFKKHYSKIALNQGIAVCRACHSGIHRLYDEMHLAKHLNTLTNLENDTALMQHVAWVARQRQTLTQKRDNL